MKKVHQCSWLLVFLLVGSLSTFAQGNANIFGDIDLLPSDMFEKGVIVWEKEFNIIPETPIPFSAAQKKQMNLPNKVKAYGGRIRVRHNGNCYEIQCGSGGQGCNGCNLLWWDRNNDGKVQPKREVRCYCPAKKKVCKIRGRKINC